MSKGLYESLKNYRDSDFYPFHMPGHKRSKVSGALADFYGMDITEIDGFDNLHQPEAMIRDAQERAAQLYHSKETYFLVNGSTAGILSAVSAIAGRAEKLIIARNCHKAVYHAAFLNRLKLYYVYPDIIGEYDIAGAIRPESLKTLIQEILSEKESSGKKPCELIAGVVITSPTYDGITSDVGKIAEIAHSYGIPLIVDQAHGAHFGMHPSYPENAVRQGADIVIHSVHKTLPAPTQTALIHRNGELTDRELLRKYLRIYQSSSPSYLLMAGIDEAVRFAGREGFARLDTLIQLKNELMEALRECRFISICPYTEPGKLVISVKDSAMTGQMLYEILREKYHLQMEMAEGTYVLAIVTMMDCKEGFGRLTRALLEIDEELAKKQETHSTVAEGYAGHDKDTENMDGKRCLPALDLHPKVKLDLRDAYLAPYEETEFYRAKGQIAAEFINLYPPGIPLLVPGEVVDEQTTEILQAYQESGYTVQGVDNNKIKIVKIPK